MMKLTKSSSLLSTLLLLATSAGAATIDKAVEQYADAKLGPAVAVSNVELAAGHGRFILNSGRAAQILAGDKVIGVYFDGDATFRYVTEDKYEFPVVTTNANKASKLKLTATPDKLTLEEKVSQVAWYGPAPALKGSSAAALDDSFSKLDATFGNAIGVTSVAQDAAYEAANGGAQFVRANAVGAEPVIYLYDPREEKVESVTTLNHDAALEKGYRELYYPSIISEQVMRARKTPPVPAFLLTALDYTLTGEVEGNVAMNVRETVVPTGADRVLRFQLISDLMIGPGKKNRSLDVKSVKTANGATLPFHHDNHTLLVELPAATTPNVPLNLTFDIAGDILYHPDGDSYWMLGVREAWYPQPPNVAGESYTVHAVVKVKAPFVPFTPGKTIRREKEGDYNVIETKIEQPVAFDIVLAGKYKFDEITKNGRTIRVASYAMSNARAYKQLAGLTADMIDYYEYFLGPFPFDEFNIIEINDLGWGQAPPATMFITSEAFSSTGDLMSQIYSQGINERLAHEIAHQYWAHVVKMASDEEQWITESFAEYSAAMLLRKMQGQGVYDRMVRKWRANAATATNVSSIALANRISMPADEMGAFMARTYLMYDKGAFLLSRLEKDLGEEQFMTFLKSYQKSFRWKFGTTEHLAGLLQFMTKRDYHPFFEANYWGTELPK